MPTDRRVKNVRFLSLVIIGCQDSVVCFATGRGGGGVSSNTSSAYPRILWFIFWSSSQWAYTIDCPVHPLPAVTSHQSKK